MKLSYWLTILTGIQRDQWWILKKREYVLDVGAGKAKPFLNIIKDELCNGKYNDTRN